MTKHIFVTGGVVSSLGKGLTSASIGMLLERRGLRVRMQKLDPYINVDPGTMSPYQHGEVYVLDDGSETDLDLGHYERFTNSPLTRDANYTTGQIYLSVIDKERRGEFLGKTVQVIPHITNEIKSVIHKLAGDDVDVVITEIGGTVGDIESQPFLEAIRQFSLDVGKENCLYIHLTLVPYLKAAGELKTKPTQHSVGQLRADRYPARHPDLPHRTLAQPRRPREDRPVLQRAARGGDRGEGQGLLDLRGAAEPGRERAGRADRQEAAACRRRRWTWTTGATCCTGCAIPKHEISIAVVGKYAEHRDAYKSIYEALDHAGIAPPGPDPHRPDPQRGDRARRARAAAGRLRRHSRARRLRRTGHRRQGRGDPLRPRAKDSVLRHLPGHAVRRDRVRPQRRRPGGRPFDRVRQGHAAPGDLPAGRAEERSPTRAARCGWGPSRASSIRRAAAAAVLRRAR